jgi:uncharacterized membrane protein
MLQREIHKDEIAKEARQFFKQGGKTKQEIFELLVDKYNYAKDVADVLKYIPSAKAIAKYGAWNTVLLVLVISIALFFLLVGFPMGWVLYGLLIYAIATKKVKYYMWATILFSGMIITFVIAGFTTPEAIFYWKNILISILTIPCCFLPLWLQGKLCPKPTKRKEEYRNYRGERRMRIVYEFSDMG